jgi:hypothetical protein
LLPVEPDWEDLRLGLQLLTQFAVEVRYPGQTADKSMARDAVAHCKQVRELVRKRLRLRE